MTEAEWSSCQEVGSLLAYVLGKVSARKLRLFACACCRTMWEWLGERACRRAVEVAECHADGLEDDETLKLAREAVQKVREFEDWHSTWRGHLLPWRGTSSLAYCVAHAAYACAAEDADDAAFTAAAMARQAIAEGARLSLWPHRTVHDPRPVSKKKAAPLTESQIQARWLRDIVGNPFRPVLVEASWLAWAGGTARRIAETVYRQRAFDRLPILADTLEDAGCDSADLLDHLRKPGDHVRGCWAVDRLLNRA